jgi:hypothetical protein
MANATRIGPDVASIVRPGTEGTRNGEVTPTPELPLSEGPDMAPGSVGRPDVYRPARYRLPTSGNIRVDN